MNSIRFGNATPRPFYLAPENRGVALKKYKNAQNSALDAYGSASTPYQQQMAKSIANLAEGMSALTSITPAFPQAYREAVQEAAESKA